MQQIATSDTTIAVSTLPIELDSSSANIITDDKESFQSLLHQAEQPIKGEMTRQSKQKSHALEKTQTADEHNNSKPDDPQLLPENDGQQQTESTEQDFDWVEFVQKSASHQTKEGFPALMDVSTLEGEASDLSFNDDQVIPLPENVSDDLDNPVHIPLPMVVDDEQLREKGRILDGKFVLSQDELKAIVNHEVAVEDTEVLKKLADDIVRIVLPEQPIEVRNIDELRNIDDVSPLDTSVELVKQLVTSSNNEVATNKQIDETSLEAENTHVQPIALADLSIELDTVVETEKVDMPVLVPQIPVELSNKGTAPVVEPLQTVSLTEEQVDLVIKDVLSVLPANVDKQAIESSIRGDLAAANAELISQKKQGRTPGIDLQLVVSQTLESMEEKVPSDVIAEVKTQVNKTEHLIGIASSIVDSAHTQIQTTLNRQSESNKTTETNDQSFVAAMDKLNGEAATTATEQTKWLTKDPIPQDKAVPIHQPEGQKQVAEKIRWMIGSRVATADIRLDPPELGSMQIRVSVAGDTASVSMVVQSVQARDMLADAQPKLRDMLSEQGLDLGDSFVMTQDQRQSEDNAEEQGSGGGGFAEQGDDEDMVVKEQTLHRAQSPYNVDAYV